MIIFDDSHSVKWMQNLMMIVLLSDNHLVILIMLFKFLSFPVKSLFQVLFDVLSFTKDGLTWMNGVIMMIANIHCVAGENIVVWHSRRHMRWLFNVKESRELRTRHWTSRDLSCCRNDHRWGRVFLRDRLGYRWVFELRFWCYVKSDVRYLLSQTSYLVKFLDHWLFQVEDILSTKLTILVSDCAGLVLKTGHLKLLEYHLPITWVRIVVTVDTLTINRKHWIFLPSCVFSMSCGFVNAGLK